MGEPKIKVANAKKDLKSIKLTKQQVESGEYQLEEIFELENEGEILGLFWQYDLKDFVQQETSFDESARIRNFGQKEWEHLFNHPFFQRRKPQLIQAVDVKTNEEFYLLEQGQKAGPYTLDEIKSRLEDKTALLTDMVSVDGGQSWGKIYEIDEFDRRRMNLNLNLPSAPEEEVLRAYEDKVIEKINNQDSETDAIAGLAYIGNMKMGKVTDTNVEENKYETPEQIEESENVNTTWIQFFWVGLFAVSLVGIIWLFYPSENTSSSTQGTKLGKMAPVQKLEPSETWKVNKDAQAPSRAPAVRNNNRTSNTDTSRSRQTTPFKQTSTYKRAQKERQNKLRKDDDFVKVENYENENYYDDASEPVELDPVRETLSKETIDPEDAPVEDFDASNQMDPAMERDPAQESEPVEEF
jgi:hypothetical protein